jgi:hypothetical protein
LDRPRTWLARDEKKAWLDEPGIAGSNPARPTKEFSKDANKNARHSLNASQLSQNRFVGRRVP